MVLDPANGMANGEVGCLLLQHVRSSAVEEHDWEALLHSCENGGEHRPVTECNRHNWCSVGLTTTPFFCVCSVFPEYGQTSQGSHCPGVVLLYPDRLWESVTPSYHNFWSRANWISLLSSKPNFSSFFVNINVFFLGFLSTSILNIFFRQISLNISGLLDLTFTSLDSS